MGTISSEMLRGHVDTIILLSLLDCDKHTSQIKEEIESRTDGNFELKQGTFYSCLQRITNQGFVTKYHSTSQDGKRRKFFQLTEKGKAYIEENKEDWLFSRGLIDTLVSVSESEKAPPLVFTKKPVKEPVQSVEVQPVADEQLEIALTSQPDVAETAQPQEIQPVADDLSEIEKFMAGAYSEPDDAIEEPTFVEKPIPQELSSPIFAEKQEKIVEFEQDPPTQDIKIIPFTTEQSSFADQTQSVDRESQKEPAQEIVQFAKEPVKEGFIEYSKPTTQTAQTTSYVEKEQVIDDYYAVTETATHDYKAVLQKLYPHQDVESEVDVAPPITAEQKIETAEPVSDFVEGQFPLEDIFSFETPKTPSHKQAKQMKKSFVKPEKQEEQPIIKQVGSTYDFSDIEQMADVEGFKVKVSSTLARKDIGKIYINKLMASASLLNYVFLITQLIILGLATAPAVGWNAIPYIIIGVIFTIFPVTCWCMYFVEPKKKVYSLSTFKSVIGFVFIVMLNLVIITFVYAILINIDFSNVRQLLLYICYPLLFILNLPVYFFIKYLKLDNQKYFS